MKLDNESVSDLNGVFCNLILCIPHPYLDLRVPYRFNNLRKRTESTRKQLRIAAIHEPIFGVKNIESLSVNQLTCLDYVDWWSRDFRLVV